MNFFSAQKTTPLKSKLAKLFAIFLVCFFVGGMANEALAQQYSLPAENSGVNTNTQKLANGYTAIPGTKFSFDQNKWNFVPVNVGTYTENNGVGTLGNDKILVQLTDNRTGTFDLNNGRVILYEIDKNTGTTKPVTSYKDKDGKVVNLKDPSNVGANDIQLIKNSYKLEAIKNSPYTNNGTLTETQQKTYSDSVQKDVTAETQQAKMQADMKAENLSCGLDPVCILAKLIYYITVPIAGFILAMSGWFLDKVFNFTVVNLSATLKGTGSPSLYEVIKLVWGIFRDLINMTFIFLLLYASIITILKADTSQLKKTISNIIIVAVLINFSLFFTQIIIDVGNNAAVTVYNAITQNGMSGTQIKQNNIAAAFMDKLGLQSLLQGAKTSQGDNYTAMISICIFGSIFVLVLAVVFFVMAILFVARFIEFIILMMMSPLGVGSIAIPKLNDAFGGKSFWDMLISQSFFAPIMFFFIWITIKMLDALALMANPNKTPLAGMLTDKNNAAGANGIGGIGAFLLGFTVIIFMLIEGMKIAKSMSAKGASGVQSALLKNSGADWLEKKMKSAPARIATGTASGIARNTVGRTATRLADGEMMRSMQSTAFGRFLKDKTVDVSKAGFGGKKGFTQLEDDKRKRLVSANKDLTEMTFAEKMKDQEIKAAKKTEEKAKNDSSTVKNMTTALNSVSSHQTTKAELERKKVEAETDIAHATHTGNLVDLQVGTQRLADIQKEIEKTDKELVDSFKVVGVEMKDATAGSIKKASEDAEKKREEVAKANGIDIKSDPSKLTDLLDKLNIAEKKAGDELKKIDVDIKAQGIARSEAFQSKLINRRIGNLGFPSRASREAVMSMRKDANKSDTEKSEDKIAKMLKDAIKENSKKDA
jgi:hypothetical protein